MEKRKLLSLFGHNESLGDFMGTSDLCLWDICTILLKSVFGNRKNYIKWQLRRIEIEQERYFKLLSLGYYRV